MERGVSIFIDPSGAQTGGRVVKRELKEIGDAAINAQKMTDQLTRAQQEMAKSAQMSAQALTQQQDALRAKFNPTFAVLQRYKQTQDEIRQAHRLGALSTNEMANALSRERQAALSSLAALKAHTGAIQANNAAARMAAAQRANLIFQLNDIFVSLASGMNPGMVLIQQGSQISQIYGGQGGVAQALRETASMAGNVATKFRGAGIAGGIAAALIGNGLAHVKKEAEAALGASVTWGEVFSATLDVIWGKLKSTFGPAISTYLVEPVSYAFDKIMSATTDLLEWSIQGWRILFRDIRFLWDNLPDIVGAAFVGAVNVAVDHLNKLAKASSDAVDLIIDAFNDIPGVNIPKINSSDQAIDPFDNTFARRLAENWARHEEGTRALGREQPIRDFGRDIVDQIGTNSARSRFGDLANLDFGSSIQSANGLGQAVGGINTALQQTKSTAIDVNQQMMDARRSMLATFEQSASQLRNMKTELKQVQETLAAAAQTPVSEVFGRDIGNAQGAIEAAASSIQKVFAALNDGRITAQTAHESLELIRASLHQLGGDTASVDLFVDKLIKGQLHVGNLESGIKSLSASIMGIPNRVISIGIQQYTVPSAGGGTKGVNVYGGNADFSYQQYQVGGGKTVGVSAGNGSYGGTTGYYYDSPYDLGIIAGMRASGGPVEAGKQYLVGEQGPELVTMSAAGNVTNANSTAAILSGGRDTLSLIEDHLYNVVQELRIHTNYWETAESEFSEMVACLKSLKSAASSVSYSGGSSYPSGSSGGSYGGGSSGYSSRSRSSPYFFSGTDPRSGAKYDPFADYALNGNVGALSWHGLNAGGGQIGFNPYNIDVSKGAGPTSVTLSQLIKRSMGFATGGQIMPGEDQKVEFFKRNKERVIIVDDNRVSDQRGGGRQTARSERPINLNVNFNGSNIGDARSRQAMADEFRRAVQQATRS